MAERARKAEGSAKAEGSQGISFGEFYSQDVPSYGAYDNVRKIASYVDGLKLSQRKVLHTLFRRFPNPGTENKTARLASAVAECTEYLHGEASLCQVLDTMAAPYVGSNNYPLVTGHGNFGTRFSGPGSAAAPRYTYCSISELATVLFPEVDRNLCPPQTFEGSEIEPAHLMPIFPVLFLNGTDGISTGWKTTVNPRNPKEVLRYIRAVLGHSARIPRFEDSLPWFRGFQGETKWVEDVDSEGKATRKAMNYGVVEKVNSNTLHVSEIPITYTYASYMKVLDGLAEKGTIEDYDDRSDPKADRFDFVVKVKRAFFERNPDLASWVSVLGLAKPLNEQLNCVDQNGRMVEFSSVREILDRFIQVRLEFHGRRREWLLESNRKALMYATSRYLWCRGVVEDTIQLRNRKKEEVVAQLDSMEGIERRDGSYSYLLSMPMSSLTREKMEELVAEIRGLRQTIKEVSAQTPESMWLKDLEGLEKFL